MRRILPIILVLMTLTSCADYLLNRARDTEPEFGSFTDSRDGSVYQTVQLADQIWMAENLRYLPSVNPSAEGSDNHRRYYVYGYEGTDLAGATATANYVTYGVLYNHEAAKYSCPQGWHLPTDDEWKTLEFVLGLDPVDAERIEWRYMGNVGTKLKSEDLWSDQGGGDNSSGFNGLPGGVRNVTSNFSDLGTFGHFWTATTEGTDRAFFRSLRSNQDGVYRMTFFLNAGFSVRCVK